MHISQSLKLVVMVAMSLLLVGSASALLAYPQFYYPPPFGVIDYTYEARFEEVGNGIYWPELPSFDEEKPDPSEFFNPPPPPIKGFSFCEEYKQGDAFPLADRYGRTVWVEYVVTHEDVLGRNSPERFSRSMRGNVYVYSNAGCTGIAVDRQQFRSVESWRDHHGPIWPARYWAHNLNELFVEVKIDSIGEFKAEKLNSQWSWRGQVYTFPRTVNSGKWSIYESFRY